MVAYKLKNNRKIDSNSIFFNNQNLGDYLKKFLTGNYLIGDLNNIKQTLFGQYKEDTLNRPSQMAEFGTFICLETNSILGKWLLQICIGNWRYQNRIAIRFSSNDGETWSEWERL